MSNSIIFIAAGIVVLLVLMFSMYVKANPQIAFIISGITKHPRVLVGTGGFKIPIFERLDKLFLGQVTVDVKTSVPVPTHDFIDVNVDAVCKVHVDPECIQIAATNFLNMTPDSIGKEIKDSLEGNMREIVGAIDLKELVTDRDKFSDEIQNKATEGMTKLGLKIISCNIQNITDLQGLIEGLGADNTYKIKKDASVTKINSEREVKIAAAKANKEANDARVAAETEIAERNNELAIKQAELKRVSDTKRAEADAAYEIQKQEQLKTINQKTVEAQIEQTKREQVLSEEKIRIKENELRAEINAQADAAKYQTKVNSDAAKYKKEIDAQAELEQQKREAEAKAYLAEQEAKAVKAKAEAELFAQQQKAEAIKATGNAEASAIEAKGRAEAEAIEAKGLAEAKAIEKRYEAWNKFGGELAKIEMVSKYLPEVSENVAKPISAIDSIQVYGGDATSAASKLTGNVPTTIKQIMDVVKSATGVDLESAVKTKVNPTTTHREKTMEDVSFDEVTD